LRDDAFAVGGGGEFNACAHLVLFFLEYGSFVIGTRGGRLSEEGC
jgi:hypothetical protein